MKTIYYGYDNMCYYEINIKYFLFLIDYKKKTYAEPKGKPIYKYKKV